MVSEEHSKTAVEKVYFLDLGYIKVLGSEDNSSTNAQNNAGPIYAIAIKYAGGIILYDTGVSTDSMTKAEIDYAAANGLVEAEIICPIARLEEIGFSADDVNQIILSHMHVDHFGNIHRFSNAKVHIYSPEFNGSVRAFLNNELDQTGEMAQVMPQRMIKTFLDEEVDFEIMYEPRARIIPGVEVYNFGKGHSHGMSALMINTRHSGKFFAISDIAYTEEELYTHSEISFNVDNEGYNATKKEVIEIAKKSNAQLLTGHDPSLRKSLTWSIDGYYD